MLNQDTLAPSKQKISLNIPFVYILALVLIGFGERETLTEMFTDLANSSSYIVDPNQTMPDFQEYVLESKDIPFTEWRNPYLYFKTAYISEQDIIDMPTKYQASAEKDSVEKATDSG